MKFRSKLQRYIEKDNLRKSYIASLIGVSPAMVHKYLYRNSMPSYWTAVKIMEVIPGIFTMEDMGFQESKSE